MKLKFICILSFSLMAGLYSLAQDSQRILFLGNSYTNYNNLPSIVANIGANLEMDVEVASNTPGGYTLAGHSTNATSLELINQGDWDFIVLQEQSQIPSFPEAQFMQDSYPYAEELNELIETSNPCAETVFYMTWGRENGDANNCPNWPPVCTYEGMDDLLAERYSLMASDFNALVSPVGRVWRNIRENNPEINLYNADQSHPSALGSYAAAVCFYTVMFRENPLNISYNFSVSAEEAEIIRNAVKTVVYDNLETWLVGAYDLTADFQVITNSENGTIDLINQSENATSYLWQVNGEEFSEEAFTYDASGEEFVVSLTSMNTCGAITSDVFMGDFSNSIPEITESKLTFHPNPASDILNFSLPVEYVTVHDLNGKEVESKLLNSDVYSIGHLEKGVYVFLCVAKGQHYALEILVE